MSNKLIPTTCPIPEDFPAGWQAVESGIIRDGDLLVEHNGEKSWATGAVGEPASLFTNGLTYRAVYRRMACPKPQDTDGSTYGASLRVADYIAPTPATTLPTSASQRKGIPVYSGFLAYFPKAVAAVAKLSKIGNDQHNPGSPLHWDRSKSGDELDAMCRHILDIAEVDTDDTPHEVKVAWRAMANLQKSIETNPSRFEKFFAR